VPIAPFNARQAESNDSAHLLGEARKGNADAFCTLCRAYENRLFKNAMLLCRHEGAAEELAHDTVVEAWTHLHRYNGKCQFFTWLCAILFNRYRNLVRENRPRSVAELSVNEESVSGIMENTSDECETPDQTVLRTERHEALRRGMEKLSLKHREVVHLRFFVDASLESIACALNCSIGTVKSRLFNALDRLREMRGVIGPNE
jgi:RNA polymerase sigma-70 factor (ECF subfamily)